MNNPVLHHSQSWIVFTYVSFVAALAMVVVGIILMPLDLAMKGYLAMGVAMLIQSCITLTKTLRDNDEAGKLVNRLEDARTERLLMDAVKGHPGDTDVAVASRIPPFCAVVLVSVLFRLQRQFPEERARLADPVQDRRPSWRGPRDIGGRRFHRAVFSVVRPWRAARRPLRQGGSGAPA